MDIHPILSVAIEQQVSLWPCLVRAERGTTTLVTKYTWVTEYCRHRPTIRDADNNINIIKYKAQQGVFRKGDIDRKHVPIN